MTATILEKNVEVTDGTLLAGIRRLLVPKLSQIEMAERLDISRAVLANMETGRTPTPLHILNDALRLAGRDRAAAERDVIAMTQRHMENVVGDERVKAPQIRLVPYWGEVPAGDWEQPNGDTEWIQVSEAIDDLNIVCVRVRGSSMEPRLRHGQKVIVRLDSTPVDGIITLATNGDKELTLKLLRFKKGEWVLTSINPDYIDAKAEEWTILGHAVSVEEYDKSGLRA